ILSFCLTDSLSKKKVPSSRHVRMDGTHTGKLSAESVRAALRRVRGSALNFVPRDCEAEARPADETAEAEQGQRSAFCKPAATGAAKAGNRNHQGEGISVPRMRAEMGSLWSVALLRHAERAAAQAISSCAAALSVPCSGSAGGGDHSCAAARMVAR